MRRMAGEIVKTRGIVLAIHPWSRTSHVVTWLTPDHGPVSTLVKGAVRPKSAFLGQYDLFYTCDLLYYANASGELHAIREVAPLSFREHLRADWRAVALAGYAADLIRDLAPPDADSGQWFAALESFLDNLKVSVPTETSAPSSTPKDRSFTRLIQLETSILDLAGLSPDFSGMDASASWTPFAIDRGRCGEGTRTVRLSPRTAHAIKAPDAADVALNEKEDAVRFLGVFLAYHIERPADIRRSLVHLLAT